MTQLFDIFCLFSTVLIWIWLPLYYVISAAQLFLAFRQFSQSPHRNGVLAIIAAQLVAPFVVFLIHPIMPGSTWGGEPLGVSEKVLRAIGATSILCAGLMLSSWGRTIWVQIRG